MKSLYRIVSDIRKCFRLDDSVVDSETGEVFDAGYLDQLEMDKYKKLDNIGCFIKELEAEADVCSKQAEKFEKRATHARNKARQLREYVSTFCGGEKIHTDRCEFKWRKSEQVTIISEDVIPEKHKKVKTVETVDKTAVKKALKAGEIVVGASLTTKQNLQLG